MKYIKIVIIIKGIKYPIKTDIKAKRIVNGLI